MPDPGVSLDELGWCEPFARAFKSLVAAPGLVPGRVVLQQRGRYSVVTESGELQAELENRFRKTAAVAADLPSVGDWVAVRMPAVASGLATVCAVLPRLTKFSRKAAGVDHTEQVLAANVDTIFVAMGLDGDFNLRRLERYLTVAWASGCRPVVLLTKSDLCTGDELAARMTEVRTVAPNVAVVSTSVRSGQGKDDSKDDNQEDKTEDPDAIQALVPFLGRGQTIVLLGSSGVGKSTLVNALLRREALRTGDVRPSDSRGRHTTTQRQMFRVRGGALIIDTPGIRELQLWNADAGFGESFADVDAIAATCRFRDCRHGHEPGCAVVAAVASGGLPADRMASYKKLRGEQAASSGRADPGASRRRKRADASIPKLAGRKHHDGG